MPEVRNAKYLRDRGLPALGVRSRALCGAGITLHADDSPILLAALSRGVDGRFHRADVAETKTVTARADLFPATSCTWAAAASTSARFDQATSPVSDLPGLSITFAMIGSPKINTCEYVRADRRRLFQELPPFQTRMLMNEGLIHDKARMTKFKRGVFGFAFGFFRHRHRPFETFPTSVCINFSG